MTPDQQPQMSVSTLWESLKAYIRGKLFMWDMSDKLVHNHCLLRLACIPGDNIYATKVSPDIYKESLSLQAEFDILLVHHVT